VMAGNSPYNLVRWSASIIISVLIAKVGVV
jgi:hypothetical protein